MFALLGEVLNQEPEALMPIIRGSLDLAQRNLGQDRRTGSSATLLYPIDAGIRLVAKRRNFFDRDPLSASSWDFGNVINLLRAYPNEVIELAGSNTTSKNLPQRAGHLLWLLDQCPLVRPGQALSFLEIGASGGLILDALKQPKKFQSWMQEKGYRSDYAQKADYSRINPTLGIDLVKPELDWLQAVILEDDLRRETDDFIQNFARSNVVVESALNMNRSNEIRNFLDKNKAALPVIFSCFVFYQMDEKTRQEVTQQSRSLLKQQGGGLLIVSDIAKYRGFPDKAGGCVSWAEDQDGKQVSPKIMLSKSTLTEWEVL